MKNRYRRGRDEAKGLFQEKRHGQQEPCCSEVQSSGRLMPLSFLKRGEAALVTKVRGRDELHHHLENLGFVEGAYVSVVSESGSNLIIEVKGTHIALDRQAAGRVMTGVSLAG